MRSELSRQQTTAFDTFARLDKQLSDVATQVEDGRLGLLKRGTRYRILYASSPGVEIPTFPKDIAPDIRFASQLPFDFEGEIGILDHVAYLVSLLPRTMATIIESPSIAALMRASFELAWMGASKERKDARPTS